MDAIVLGHAVNNKKNRHTQENNRIDRANCDEQDNVGGARCSSSSKPSLASGTTIRRNDDGNWMRQRRCGVARPICRPSVPAAPSTATSLPHTPPNNASESLVPPKIFTIWPSHIKPIRTHGSIADNVTVRRLAPIIVWSRDDPHRSQVHCPD